MNNSAYAMISLAQKAGKLVSGEDTCSREIKAGRGKLVIVAEDSAENTKKMFMNMCNYRDIPYIAFGTKELLGKNIGKDYRAVLCLIDNNFAKLILQKISGGE